MNNLTDFIYNILIYLGFEKSIDTLVMVDMILFSFMVLGIIIFSISIVIFTDYLAVKSNKRF